MKTIEAGWKKAGLYIKQDRAIFWNAKNDASQPIASGLYFISLKAGKYSKRQRLVIQR
ncbi:MAG: hypothetical protein V2A53_03920 [bacterium]